MTIHERFAQWAMAAMQWAEDNIGWVAVILCSIMLAGIVLLSGCASTPPFPPAGPQQKIAPIVSNPNCLSLCTTQVTQSTALEDIENNAAAVTGGAQTQSATQTSTQSSSVQADPTKTVTKDDGDPKP